MQKVIECRSHAAIEFDLMEEIADANRLWLTGRSTFYLTYSVMCHAYSVRTVFAGALTGPAHHKNACKVHLEFAEARMDALTA
jgi:hypothetical protein